MSRGRRKCFVYFGNKQREFEEFRERVYEAVRHIHVTRSYNKFLYPDYKDAVEKEDKEEETTLILSCLK
jgi:GTP-binding protein HflX